MASKRKWGKGCAIGCGVIGVIVLGLVLSINLAFMIPFNKASKSEQQVDRKWGPMEDFVPNPALSSERLKVFLTIQEKLSADCPRVRELFGKMQNMEELEQGDEGYSEENLGTLIGALTGLWKLGPLLGELQDKRNQLLLEHGMGLGEYTYFYVLAYYSFLEKPFPEGLNAPDRKRIHSTLTHILQNQLKELQKTGNTVSDKAAIHAELLEKEIELMEKNPQQLPWKTRLPEGFVKVLTPFRPELERVFCPPSAVFELSTADEALK